MSKSNNTDSSKTKKVRAFELDLLRGISIVLVVLMHFSYDMRYEFQFDVFDFLEKDWFWAFVETFFLCVFVGISGICCTFSRSNLRRGIKLGLVSLAFTGVTFMASKYLEIDCLILFNVLHLLTVGILLYAFISFIECKAKVNPLLINALVAFVGVWFITIGKEIESMKHSTESLLFLPFGVTGTNAPPMADYMPIFPWLGVFLVGTVVGRVCYFSKNTLFPNASSVILRISRPFEFLGRHSLMIYLVHQPLIYGIVSGILWLFGKK